MSRDACGCYEPGCACEERDALRAEVAALRRDLAYERRLTAERTDQALRMQDLTDAAERELAEARALLAEVDGPHAPGTAHTWNDRRRAFLRRDEVCEPGNCNQPRGHGGPCPVWRDEAP